MFFSATRCVLLFAIGCVLFDMHYGKGICLFFLGMCNGCVVHSTIGFDVGGFHFTFGLFVVSIGNVG